MLSQNLIHLQTLHLHGNKKTDSEATPLSSWQLIQRPDVTKVLVIYNYVMLLAFTFTAVFPVFQYTPVDLGGLGFSSAMIAACTGINGGSQSFWLLLVFPNLHRRIGTGRILWWAASAWPVFFLAAPIYHYLLANGYKTLFWSTGPPALFLGSSVAMAFSTFFFILFSFLFPPFYSYCPCRFFFLFFFFFFLFLFFFGPRLLTKPAAQLASNLLSTISRPRTTHWAR